MAPGTRNKVLAKKLCSCIKKVRKTVKVRKVSKGSSTKKAREQAAIGICVRSVLQTRGKTLKRFSCLKKPVLVTQSL
jgi:predicted P-loop ATPase